MAYWCYKCDNPEYNCNCNAERVCAQVHCDVRLADNSFENEHVKFLILPTIHKMKQIGVVDLKIEIRNGKAQFEMFPDIDEEDAGTCTKCGRTDAISETGQSST